MKEALEMIAWNWTAGDITGDQGMQILVKMLERQKEAEKQPEAEEA